MWNNLQQAKVRLGDTVKALTNEALETAHELRHKGDDTDSNSIEAEYSGRDSKARRSIADCGGVEEEGKERRRSGAVGGVDAVSDRLAALKARLGTQNSPSVASVTSIDGGEGGKDGIQALEPKLKDEQEKRLAMERSHTNEIEELKRGIEEERKRLKQQFMQHRRSEDEGGELAVAKAALEKSQMELEVAKNQLNRLKAQMMTLQEEEEEKLQWRVDAEVKLRMEQLGISSNGVVKDSQLEHDLEIAVDKAQELEKESSYWKSVANAKSAELSNMQRALDDLSYESETAEKLRVEVRVLSKKVSDMESQVEQYKDRCSEWEAEAKKAVQLMADEKKKAAAAREAEGAARQEMISLQLAYNGIADKLNNVDNDRIFQREFVVDLVKQMASMRHSHALRKASQVLSLTEAEQKYVFGDDSGSLANTWVTFLQSQVKEEGQ